MPERVVSTQAQRLPTETILTILERAIDNRPWEIGKLTLISKELRNGLKGRLFQQLHVHSMAQLRSLIVRGWPHHSKSPLNRSALSLYLQFIDLASGLDQRLLLCDLCQKLLSFPPWVQQRIETFGMRAVGYTGDDSGAEPTDSWGLWPCSQLPNVRRLYVDASMMPPLEEDGWKDADGVRGAAGINQMPYRRLTEETYGVFVNVEAYAINCNRLEDLFGTAGQFRRSFIKKAFPKLQRLYLFTVPWQQGGGMDLQEQLDDLLDDFDAATPVKLVSSIITEDDKPMQWCARPCTIVESNNGTMALMNIHVRAPKLGKQDMLAFMHRIIDDIDREWAPEAFQGQRWDPKTRPAYIYGVPCVSSLERQGDRLPFRMRHLQTWNTQA